MSIFRQLRWKLTLSYTLVTVGAFLVITLVMSGIVLPQIFIPESFFSPERLIEIVQEESLPLWSYILGQSPVDKELINQLLINSETTITSPDLFRMGAIQVSARTVASSRILIIGADGILLGTRHAGSLEFGIGDPMDTDRVPGLEAPLKAALAGERDVKRLYTVFEPNKRFLLAVPVFNIIGGHDDQVVGVIVVIFDYFPTQEDIPSHILNIAGRSLLVFLLGVGIMGALFGAFFANGLAKRFARMSATTDLWSEGDFSRYIDDATGDEISHFAQRLNNMARQLQSLLRRRQDMAVSEERNRLARDLHDSAKQQALAASFELGTALTLYERDPQEAKEHLAEADMLVDSVRRELTNLVDELRPQPMDEDDFSEILKGYGAEWSHRSGIKLNVHVDGSDENLPPVTRESLFRIAQEALANVARHSSASQAELSIDYEKDSVILVIKDDGRGLDTSAPHSGLGLYSMQERAESLGGSFSVASEPGRGTRIVVALPKSS